VWGDDLAAGTAKRPAELGPLEVVAAVMVAVGDEAEGFRDYARPMLALYIGGMGARGRNFYNDVACRYGFEAEAKEIQDLYLDGKKDEAAKAIPDQLLEAATICGPEGYVRDRLAAYEAAGVTVLNATLIGPDVPALAGKLKEWMEHA
jgi:Luciferase-like monooxygenase